jgi:hypothetical protein
MQDAVLTESCTSLFCTVAMLLQEAEQKAMLKRDEAMVARIASGGSASGSGLRAVSQSYFITIRIHCAA